MCIRDSPYTKPQEYIRDHAPADLFTVLMRRSMLRIANILCKHEDARAIITGESLAQVASQTLMALACTDAAQDLPVLRPCIGMDKTEITHISRQIGTYETSIEPYDCLLYTSDVYKRQSVLRSRHSFPADLGQAAVCTGVDIGLSGCDGRLHLGIGAATDEYD